MTEPIASDLLAAMPHGFSTRDGAEASDILPGAGTAMVRQVHSAKVVEVDGAVPEDTGPEADALVTTASGVLLAIVTADCAPVLLADLQARVIGAAHAGWRGAHGGVIENTVNAMERLGADPARMLAAVGPCIHQANYEVDEPFRQNFPSEDERFFTPGREGHWQFDLPGYVASRLRAAGVSHIDVLPYDTYGDAARFHSYRRSTHRGEPTEGRQVSLIGLRESA